MKKEMMTIALFLAAKSISQEDFDKMTAEETSKSLQRIKCS